ncbi:MAG: DUF92 domain-containing protein [Terriglobia bacterium]
MLFSITWYETAGLAVLILLLDVFSEPAARTIDPAFRALPVDAEYRKPALLSHLPATRSRWESIVPYPAAIFALALIFRHHLDVVAAAWALLAVGDGAAGAAGEALGSHPLPFNLQKTWEGFAAFIVFGCPAAFTLFLWTAPSEPHLKTFGVCLFAAVAGAFAESLPIRLDDNITVPLLTAGFIFCASLMTRAALGWHLPYLGVRIALAVGINAAFALVAWGLSQVTVSGAIAGFLLGVAVYMGFGYKSFLILLGFFVMGATATRLGYSRKVQRGVAENRRGARSWREATANVLAAAFFAILAITTPYQAAFLTALVAALAEAAGDTVASEIGKWVSMQAYLVTTLKAVPAGEDGGISVAGTAAGFAASALLVATAYGLGLSKGWGVLAALLAAFAGNLADSFVGATLERSGLMTNAAVNFVGTSLAGALVLAWALH